MPEEDELLDLVNGDDQVIGTILRSESGNLHLENRGYIRAAQVFIRNKEGKLWIPRRTLNKRIAPGGLDYSAAGHVPSGRTYKAAAIQEAKEELNLDIPPEKLKLIHKFRPIGEELAYFLAVYVYESDKVPDFNKEDFTEYFWLSPKELLDKINAGEPAKRSLKATVEYLVQH